MPRILPAPFLALLLLFVHLLSSSSCTQDLFVNAATFSTCQSNTLTLDNRELATSDFSVPSGCTVHIRRCSAELLRFNDVQDITLRIEDLTCTATTAAGGCVEFYGNVSSTSPTSYSSVSIDGVSRVYSGSDAGGRYLVHFSKPVVAHVISVKNVHARINVTAAAGNVQIEFKPVFFVASVTSVAGLAGSALIVSDCRFEGQVTASTLDFFAVSTGSVIGFERIHCANISIRGMSFRTDTGVQQIYLVYFAVSLVKPAVIDGAGVSNTRITVRNNSMSQVQAECAGRSCTIVMFKFGSLMRLGDVLVENNTANGLVLQGAYQHFYSVHAASNVSVNRFAVSDLDITNVSVAFTDSTRGQLFAVLVDDAATLNLTGDDRILSFTGVRLGGRYSYRGYMAPQGARVVRLASVVPASVAALSVSNCHMDFAQGVVTTTTNVFARVVDFGNGISGVQRAVIEGCSVSGVYMATTTVNLYVEICIVHVQGLVLDVALFSVADCVWNCTATATATSTAPLRVDAVHFANVINRTNISISNLDCGSVHGGDSDCINFAGGAIVHGGGSATSIFIDRVRRRNTGGVGVRSIVRMRAAVSASYIVSITRVVGTYVDISVHTGVINIFPVMFSRLTSSGHPGSYVNVSDCSFSFVGLVNASGLTAGMIFSFIGVQFTDINGFHTVETSRNSASGMNCSVPGGTPLSLIDFGSIAGLGSGPATNIIIRGNSFDGATMRITEFGSRQVRFLALPTMTGCGNVTLEQNSMRNLVAAGRLQAVHGFYFKSTSTARTITVNELDMRGFVIVASASTTEILVSCVFLNGGLIFALPGSGWMKLTVSNVKLSGRFNFSLAAGSNVRLMHAASNVANVDSIAITNNVIDLVEWVTAGTIGATCNIAVFSRGLFSLRSAVFSNNLITGRAQVIGSAGLNISVVRFLRSATGSGSNSAMFSLLDSVINGKFSSAEGYICLSVAEFDANGWLSSFATQLIDGAAITAEIADGAPAPPPANSSTILRRCGTSTSITTPTQATSSTSITTTTSTATTTMIATTIATSNTVESSSATTRSGTSSFPNTTSSTIIINNNNNNNNTTMISDAQITASTSSSSTNSTSTTPTPSTTSESTATLMTTTNTSNSTSHNITLSPDIRAVAAVVPAAATSTATSLSIFAAPSAAASMRSLSAAASLLLCYDEVNRAQQAKTLGAASPPPPELAFDSNPLFLRVGSVSSLAEYGGSVVSYIVIASAVLVGGYAAAFVRSKCSASNNDGEEEEEQDGGGGQSRRMSLLQAARNIGHPGIVAIATSIFAPPAISSSVVLVAHPLSSGMDLLVLGIAGMVCSLLPLLLLLFLARHFGQHETLLSGGDNVDAAAVATDNNNEDDGTAEQQQQESLGSSCIVAIVDFLTAPRRAYRNSFYADSFRLFVDSHISVYFSLADFAVALALSGLSGVSTCCASPVCCHVTSYSAAIVSATYLLVVLLKSPFLVRWDAFNIPLTLFLTVVTTVLAVVTAYSSGSGDSDVGGGSVSKTVDILAQVIFVIALASLAVSAVSNTLPAVIWLCSKSSSFPALFKTLQKRRSERDRRAQDSAPINVRVVAENDDGAAAAAAANDAPLLVAPLPLPRNRSSRRTTPSATTTAAAATLSRVPPSHSRRQQQQLQPPPRNLRQMMLAPSTRAQRQARNDEFVSDAEQLREVLLTPPRRHEATLTSMNNDRNNNRNNNNNNNYRGPSSSQRKPAERESRASPAAAAAPQQSRISDSHSSRSHNDGAARQSSSSRRQEDERHHAHRQQPQSASPNREQQSRNDNNARRNNDHRSSATQQQQQEQEQKQQQRHSSSHRSSRRRGNINNDDDDDDNLLILHQAPRRGAAKVSDEETRLSRGRTVVEDSGNERGRRIRSHHPPHHDDEQKQKRGTASGSSSKR